MNALRNLASMAVVATVFVTFTPRANAQMILEKIRVTVSEPVEVPGMVLPIGNYVFEAMENGKLTRILSADESHVYTTLLTAPLERSGAVERPAVTLKETAKGDVGRIDSWFYPGDSIGNEFLYQKTPLDRNSTSRISAVTKDFGHAMSEAVRDSVAAPEYLAVHVERAVVRSSAATGRFLGSRFLVV